MDTITHGIVGALIGKSFTFESEHEGRIATFAVTAGAVFPDSDTFIPPFYHDKLAFIEIHRGITHSLLMLPLFALLFGWLTALLLRRRSKWPLYSLLYGIGIGSHIFLDVITSYGTMIWSPISKVRVSWDWVFIIDVVFTSIALLPQLLAWVYSDRERARGRGIGVWLCSTSAGAVIAWAVQRFDVHISGLTLAASSVLIAVLLWIPSWGGRGFLWRRSAYCRAGVAVLAVYLGICAVTHRAALARVETFARVSGVSAERIAALPAPPSFFRWSGLVQSTRGVYRGSISIKENPAADLAASESSPYRFFPNAEDNLYVRTAESLPQVKRYLWFARFPWITYRMSNGPQVVEIRDAQFLWPPRSGDPPFTFRVLLDGEGHVLGAGLSTR